MLLAVAGWRTHPSNFYEEKLSFNINEYFPWESLWPMTVQRFPIIPPQRCCKGMEYNCKVTRHTWFWQNFPEKVKMAQANCVDLCFI